MYLAILKIQKRNIHDHTCIQKYMNDQVAHKKEAYDKNYNYTTVEECNIVLVKSPQVVVMFERKYNLHYVV